MKKLYEEASVRDIANAIREKNRSTETYKISEMAGAIKALNQSQIIDQNLENTIQYPQMNDTVAKFVQDVAYDTTDYTTTQVTNYYNKPTAYSKEEPRGLHIKVPNGTAITVTCDRKTREETASGEHFIYNIEPLKNATLSFGGKVYKVVAESGVRMIYTPSVYNVRDLGGWLCDGGRVKYGKLFRGSEFTGGNTNNITANDISALKSWCGIKVDLDLRNNSESNSETTSPLGAGVEYYRYSIYAYAQAFANSDRMKLCVEAVKKIIESVNAGKPVYFHCVSGADRTGTIAFILLSLLGVSPSDKDKEYELTAFTEEVDAARFRNSNYAVTNGNSWYALVSYFRTNFTGKNDTEKVVAWATKNGISADSINLFRGNMISGIISDVNVPAQTFKVTNALRNCSTDNPSETVTEGDGYIATITANGGYTLDNASTTITMGGVDITATVYKNGIIDIPNVTGSIVITIYAEVYVPSYTNILPSALTPNTKSEVWDGKGYRNGAYASSASPYYGTDASYFCTGAIPYNGGDVIYVKGAMLEGSGHARLQALSQTGCFWCREWVSLSGMAQVEKLSDKYYKFVLDNSHPDYAYVKYIMFSALGKADELIVTRNEPIT